MIGLATQLRAQACHTVDMDATKELGEGTGDLLLETAWCLARRIESWPAMLMAALTAALTAAVLVYVLLVGLYILLFESCYKGWRVQALEPASRPVTREVQKED